MKIAERDFCLIEISLFNIMNTSSVKYIVIHCSATRCHKRYRAQQLEHDHQVRGFRCAGYHYYVERDGKVTQFRHLNETGAHARGYNRCSIGICYEGGLLPNGTPSDTRTEIQKVKLKELISYVRHYFPQKLVVVGHRDLSPDRNGDGIISPSEWVKVCPCFDARSEYNK